MLDWARAEVRPWRRAFNRPIMLAGASCGWREGLKVAVPDDRGHILEAEVAPLPGFSRESLAEALADLQHCLARRILKGATTPACASVAFALDCLEAQLLPCQPLPVPVPLLQGDPEQLLQDWRGRSQRPGCIKLKVGRTTARQTQALVQGLLAESPELRLRLDANRAWSLSEGLDRVSSLPLSNIDYIEEPCTHWQDSVRLHRQTGVPWALDEHTRLLDVQAAGLPGLNMLVIKPTLLGGFGQCRAWIDAGRARGVAACISSSYETETGLGLLARLARMWTPGVPPGLDTAGIFAPLPSPGDALDAPRF